MTSLFEACSRTRTHQGLSGGHQIATLLLTAALGQAYAQAPTPPAEAPATPGAAQATDGSDATEAMKRSRRMAENPFKWIKMHGDTKRKPEATKPEPAKPEPVKPRPPSEQTTAETARPKPRPPEAVAAPVVPDVARPKVITETASPVPQPPAVEAPAAIAPPTATAAAVPPSAPASAPASAQTAATPPPDDANDDELRPISTLPPEFPRALRGLVSSGRVTVVFTVQPDGSVGESSAESSTNRRLSKAALDAVNKWKFEPIVSSVTYKVEFDFKE